MPYVVIALLLIPRKMLMTIVMQTFKLNKDFSKREFIYVTKGDIDHDKSYIDVNTIPQTRQIHQVTNSPVPYVINKMRPSCLCHGCLTSYAALCSNSNIVMPTLDELPNKYPRAFVPFSLECKFCLQKYESRYTSWLLCCCLFDKQSVKS